MNDPIDYSRPVGWWCAYCEEDAPCTRTAFGIPMACKNIPVYRELPTPEPVEVDEVETGEAEVVTLSNPHGSCRLAECSVWIDERGWIEDGEAWCDGDDPEDVVLCIEDIAAASANARKKRGMK